MLDFIDRFADPRFVADKQLRCSAIWVGVVENDPAFVEYLSPDDVDESQFVADAGDDYYDVDFLEAGFSETRPADAVIAELAGDRDLSAEQVAKLRQAAAERGVTEANAWIILEQHVYEGDATVDFGGLALFGDVEYCEPEPVESASPA
ncbi:immunity 22 family protein [Gulosibacter sp. ACHW.36C]|uniref:Immunity 22 family protein n=1 Tax=Gulosibacter sediminis TaxID=1729695 RepID=A0ABY4MXH6_9MICO|nr:immunity 22 family protein [Gulosibacter sediminis]UQN14749.1 immunity 22 family protein [Gulosibacter sediminis]